MAMEHLNATTILKQLSSLESFEMESTLTIGIVLMPVVGLF